MHESRKAKVKVKVKIGRDMKWLDSNRQFESVEIDHRHKRRHKPRVEPPSDLHGRRRPAEFVLADAGANALAAHEIDNGCANETGQSARA